MKIATSFRIQDEEDSEDFHYAYMCPHCMEIEDVPDKFEWVGINYQMIWDCQNCGNETRVIKNEIH